MSAFGSALRSLSVAMVALVVANGCNHGEADTATGGTGGGQDAGGSGGGVAASYTSLITADWQLEPFSELTSDKHLLTLDRDIYVNAIRPIAPKGTHHTILSSSHLGESTMLYGSGIGTNDLEFPPGVGLKLPAGTTLVLELHLFNPSDAPLAGTSGIEIVEVEAGEVVDEADVYLPGPMALTIPPNEETTAAGTCTALAPFTVFAMMPHMHQLGSHLRTTIEADGVETVIHDGDFSFDEQLIRPVDLIEVEPGDKITTECTFINTTSDLVTWGVSSTDEMCFSILYRYPAAKDGGFCTQ